MSGPEARSIPWRRLGAESAAILVSILLAFAIDAWWDGHLERQRESALLVALAEDFSASRALLEDRLVLARRIATGNQLFLDALRSHDGDGPLSVPDSLVLAVISGPTYEPNTSALDAAVATGELDLLRSPALRVELATWRRLLSDTAEDELEVRRITNEQVVPELARSLGLGPYFAGVLPWTGGDPHGAGIVIRDGSAGPSGGRAVLDPSTELEGALAMRGFYGSFAAADLSSLLGSLDRITSLLVEMSSEPGR